MNDPFDFNRQSASGSAARGRFRRSQPGASRIALLAAEEAFEQGVPPEELDAARRAVRVPRLDVPRGDWTPAPADWAPPTLGAMVVEGMIACHVRIRGRASTELIGPGDVFSPWRPAASSAIGEMTSSAWAPTTLAVLDESFLAAARRWPGLLAVSHVRLAERLDRMMLRTAALQLSRVEERLLAAMWQLADRFGHVTPEGISLPLPLTHQILGQLVGAQRPTVTLALRALEEEGAVSRRDDGLYVLARGSREKFDELLPAEPAA